MKLSAKSRYAIAALIEMGQISGAEKPITIISLSEKLGISKIYLEQVFSLLKRGEIVVSIKGAQGGYQLSRPMQEISAYDILSSTESSLFEQPDQTVADSAPNIESVLQNDILKELDTAISEALKKIKLDALVAKAGEYGNAEYMYYL